MFQWLKSLFAKEKLKTSIVPSRGWAVDSWTTSTANYRKAFLENSFIKSALLTKLASVFSLDFALIPASDSSSDVEIADFCQRNIARVGIRSMTEKLLLPGLIEGRSIAEPLYSVIDNQIQLVAIKSKSPDYYSVVTDEYRNIIGIESSRTNEQFSPADFLIFTWLSLYDDAGRSDLAQCYRAASYMSNIWKLRAVSLERWTIPALVGKIGSEAEQDSMAAVLESIRSQTWAVVPATSDIQVLQLASSSNADFAESIRDLALEIYQCILGSSLQAMQGSDHSAGSSAVHAATGNLLSYWLVSAFEEVINQQLLPKLVGYNFGAAAALPTFKLSMVSEDEMSAAIANDIAIQSLGIELDTDELLRRYGRTGTTKADAAPLQENELRATVGGLNAIAALQTAYYAGTIPQEACIANTVLLFGFNESEATSLFPPIAPTKLTPDEPAPAVAPGGQPDQQQQDNEQQQNNNDQTT